MTQWTSALVSEHLPVLRRYARALEQDAERADDLVQQALLQALERSGSFRPDLGTLRSWLLSIVHNQFVTRRRRIAVEQRHLANLADAVGLAGGPADQEQAVFVREVVARFAALPDAQRAVVHLIAVEGLSYQETAAAIDAPIGTVMSRLSRARAALREPVGPADRRGLRMIGGTDAS